MLTPAQNPRGLARMIFTKSSLVRRRYPTGAGAACQASPENSIATRKGGDLGDCTAWIEEREACLPRLFEVNLGDFDGLLAVLFRDLAGHCAFLRGRADRLVFLLVAGLVEVVDDVFAALLHLDDGGAARLAFNLEVALGARDGALEGHLLVVGGQHSRHHGEHDGHSQQLGPSRSHCGASLMETCLPTSFAEDPSWTNGLAPSDH